MDSVHILHLGCVSSVFLASKQAPDQDQKVVKAYHKGHLQVRHWLNITREVNHLRYLKDLRVPGIVDLCGTADDVSNLYLVFEPCFGGDLYKRLANKGLFKEEQLCKEVVAPLLKVLHSLHQLGIIHRDIKPENIFFEADGTLRLGDFGLAINATKERPISRVGTLDYMAPEVLAQPSADVIALRKIKPGQLPSYDSAVDIWALGVLVYEALMGVTPFSDTDPQAASLKAQFRPPLPLPPGVSAACADFVNLALTKQASNRPSAIQLLAHPWVTHHMPGLEAPTACMEASAQRASSSGSLSRASSMDQATPSSCSSGDPEHAAADQACCSSSDITSASGCEMSSNSAAAAFLPVAGRIWKPRQQLHGPAADTMFQRPCQLVLQKQQPLLPQPQQVPPHPFAAAAAQYGATTKVLSPPLLQPQQVDNKADGACASTGQQDLQARGQSSAPLPIPMQQPAPRTASSTRGFSRQLSSPARLRAAHLLQDLSVAPADPSSSPPPLSSSSRISALAMSPMRALLGAGRNLVRSRSGAAAPAADGSSAAVSKRDSSHSMSALTLRSPLPSPIKGLLQPSRRKPAQSASASLFAAAQWKPSDVPTSEPQRRTAGSSTCSSSVRFSGTCTSSTRSSSSIGAPKGLDSSSFLRACSMGPNVVLGAGLCSQGSSAEEDLPAAESACVGTCSTSTSSPAAAAVAAVELHTQQLPVTACGAGGNSRASAAGRQQQPALLNRYPSAPDPGPLLALSPVRDAAKCTGVPPLAVSLEKQGSQGMRGVWLRVQGVCRKVSKQCSKDGMEQDAHCLVARSPS